LIKKRHRHRAANRPQPNLDELRALSARTIADARRAADIIRRIRDMATRAETDVICISRAAFVTAQRRS
jgi:hypothetical protein